MRKILTNLICLTLLSCNYFDNKKVDAKDIVNEELQSIKWNEVDEYPSFAFCDSLEGKNSKRECFQNYLSDRVTRYLGDQPLIVSQLLNEEANMVVSINAEGMLSVDTVKVNQHLKQEIPAIDSLLSRSLDSLPDIYPAIKRGQQVKTQFTLPIKIVVE